MQLNLNSKKKKKILMTYESLYFISNNYNNSFLTKII